MVAGCLLEARGRGAGLAELGRLVRWLLGPCQQSKPTALVVAADVVDTWRVLAHLARADGGSPAACDHRCGVITWTGVITAPAVRDNSTLGMWGTRAMWVRLSPAST